MSGEIGNIVLLCITTKCLKLVTAVTTLRMKDFIILSHLILTYFGKGEVLSSLSVLANNRKTKMSRKLQKAKLGGCLLLVTLSVIPFFAQYPWCQVRGAAH